MKKPILFAIVAATLSLSAHADWDPVRDAQDTAAAKARQERSVREKAENDKKVREATQKHQRAYLGKDAIGKSDAEVTRIYDQRQSDVLKQTAAIEAAVKASERQPKQRNASAGMEQADAAMKAMYGKSVNDIGNMSEKEREAFFRDLEKKYPK